MSNPSPFSSLIIPCFRNGPELGRLRAQLSLQDTTLFEVLVVSDGCAATLEIALKARTPYRLNVLDTRLSVGFGVVLARNLGARFSLGSQLIFLDPDILLPEKTVEGFQEAFETCTLLVGSIISVADDDLDTVVWPEGRPGFVTSQFPEELARFAGIDLATAFAAVDRDSFLELGGFDMSFLGQGGSDTDFGLRHSLNFGRVRFLNDLVCRHVGLSSGKLHAMGKSSRYPRIRQKRLLADGAAYYRDPANWIVNDGRAFFEGNEEFWQSMVIRLAD